MDEIFNSGQPTVLDVAVDPDEPPPMKQRMAALEEIYD